MITSDAPGPILDRLRRLAGPNPAGSRITDAERLHLIYHLTALRAALQGGTSAAYGAVRTLREQLESRGMTYAELGDLVEVHPAADPVLLADLIAVHPSLRDNDYLD